MTQASSYVSSYASSLKLLGIFARAILPSVLNQSAVATRSQLHLGSCLDVLSTLHDESVDLLLTDPPYGINYLSRSHSLALTKIANDDSSAYDLLDKALGIAVHKLKSNSHIYVFTNWQAYEPMAAIVRKYFNLKNVLIWAKNNCTRGDLKGNYGYAHEMIFYAHKGRRYLSGKREGNILHFDRVPSNFMQHPTEKPVKMLEYLIQKSTQPGEMVLDPFMGVGSTCVAAKHTNRQYIGIELEPVWFEVAKERLSI